VLRQVTFALDWAGKGNNGPLLSLFSLMAYACVRGRIGAEAWEGGARRPGSWEKAM